MGEGARARGPRPASAHAPTRGDMVDGMAGGLDDLRLGGAGPVAAAPVRDAAAELREGAAAQLERCLLPLSLTLNPNPNPNPSPNPNPHPHQVRRHSSSAACPHSTASLTRATRRAPAPRLPPRTPWHPPLTHCLTHPSPTPSPPHPLTP